MSKVNKIVSKVVYIILWFFSFLLWIKCFLIWSYFLSFLFLVLIPLTIYKFYFNEEKYWLLNWFIAFYIILSPFLFIFNSFYNATNDVNALWRYKTIINDFWTSKLVSHFPKYIPDNATDEKFSFLQMFLQAWWHINLMIHLEEADFEGIYNNFKTKQPDNIILPDFTSDFPSFRYIDEDLNNYKTIYLTAKPYKSLKDNFPWNHWKASWISFNFDEYKIIYWAEFW